MRVLTIRRTLALAALAVAVPFAAHAIEPDEVRGEVVSVSPDTDELTIEVTESGADMAAQEGSTETYDVQEGTEIEFEIDSRVYAFKSAESAESATLADLSEGDNVLLRFDSANGRAAVGVRNEEPADTALRERVQREGRDVTDEYDEDRYVAGGSTTRDTLPDTASVLPALFGAGALLALVAFGLRRRRRA